MHICHQKLLLSVLLAVLLLAIYGNVIKFDFASIDDQVYVSQNPHIQNGLSLGGVAWVFKSSHAANWHPLTSLSLMIDYELFGLNAGGYHFTNLLFHILNTLLLFFLLSKMTGSSYRSFFVAVLFAIHPMHVESVAWIAERKDVLSAFFWLLTIWAYFLYAKKPGIKTYALIITFFVLGLMSKPMVVTLPFVLLLLDYWPINRSAPIKNLLIEKIPLFLLSAVSSVITYIVQKQAGAVVTMEAFPADVRIYNAVVSYYTYLEKALLPINLSVYYPHPGMWPFEEVVLSGSILVLLSILILRNFKRNPYLPVGWLWYLGTLAPVIGIVQVGSQAMADRYSYLPFIGLFVIASWGITDLVRNWHYKKAVLGFVSILVIISFSFLSWQRCQLWGDQVALWTDALKNHEIAFAYNIRGLSYAEKREYKQAISDYNAALALKPNADFYNNRSIAYSGLKHFTQSLDDVNSALSMKPTFADGYYNRGLLHNTLGKYHLAVLDFTSALKYAPDMQDAFLSRGIAYGFQKQYEKALADFEQALRINHNFFQAYYNRGIVYDIYGNYDFAIENFMAALKIQPTHAPVWNYLGLLWVKKGEYSRSLLYFKKALQIKPDYDEAAKNLQVVLDKIQKEQTTLKK